MGEIKHLVYIHINKINNKVYVGQTCNLYERWRCEGKNYFNSLKFFRAIKKYGWDNFEHKIIADNLTQEEADKYEIILIKIFNSIKAGYNLKEGGARGLLSKESLLKMSESLKRGYLEHPERKQKISAKKKGQKHTEESKKKLSEAIRKIRYGSNNPFYGKHHSDETIRRIKEKMSGVNSPRANKVEFEGKLYSFSELNKILPIPNWKLTYLKNKYGMGRVYEYLNDFKTKYWNK